MKIVSWNVNGIRAAARKGFWTWLSDARPDCLCLQETRIQPQQLTQDMREPTGYVAFWHSAERKGYSGVSTFASEQPLAVQEGFGQPTFDVEGRVLLTKHPGFTLLNVYFPNGRRGHDRVQYKLRFYDSLRAYCAGLRAEGQHLIVCGDFNTAHQPIDLARPKENADTSGFLPEEREAVSRWSDDGFVDVYRHFHPTSEEYTWWTYRFQARERNIGWRLDYFFVVAEALDRVADAFITPEVMGSDHCPVGLRLQITS